MTAPTDAEFGPQVRRKARRMQRARGNRSFLWRQLANVGVLGWIFMLPVLLGAFLGRAVAKASGSPGLGLLPLLSGLGIGAFATYRQVRRSLEQGDDQEPGS